MNSHLIDDFHPPPNSEGQLSNFDIEPSIIKSAFSILPALNQFIGPTWLLPIRMGFIETIYPNDGNIISCTETLVESFWLSREPKFHGRSYAFLPVPFEGKSALARPQINPGAFKGKHITSSRKGFDYVFIGNGDWRHKDVGKGNLRWIRHWGRIIGYTCEFSFNESAQSYFVKAWRLPDELLDLPRDETRLAKIANILEAQYGERIELWY